MTEQNHSPELDQLDQLFTALRGATPRPGLEGRILAHLRREARGQQPESRGLGLWRRSPASSLRRLAPVSIAASLVCVLAGGLAVEHEYSLSIAASHATQASITQAAVTQQTSVQAQAAAFGTASARREPAGAIPAGTRRGRAARSTSHAKPHPAAIPH
jgi:hypothetical protein